MAKNKKQHWIPQCYLAAWADPTTPEGQNPFVWKCSLDGSIRKRKAPDNIFFENDLYTIQRADGTRDLTLEHGLSELEGNFASIRRGILAGLAPVSDQDKLWLSAFTAAMLNRTRRQRNHFAKQWNEVLKVGDAIKASMKNATEEQKRVAGMIMPGTGPSLTYDEVQDLARAPLQNTLAPAVSLQTPILCRMNMAIVATDDELGFITSDAPCMLYDPEATKRPWPYNTATLGSPTAEIILPISPQQFLLFTHRGPADYLVIERSQVAEINRQVRSYADEHIILSRDEVKPEWFVDGDARVESPAP